MRRPNLIIEEEGIGTSILNRIKLSGKLGPETSTTHLLSSSTTHLLSSSPLTNSPPHSLTLLLTHLLSSTPLTYSPPPLTYSPPHSLALYIFLYFLTQLLTNPQNFFSLTYSLLHNTSSVPHSLYSPRLHCLTHLLSSHPLPHSLTIHSTTLPHSLTIFPSTSSLTTLSCHPHLLSAVCSTYILSSGPLYILTHSTNPHSYSLTIITYVK